jgi:1-acyl-sn-glycerol-3-phosphate acyltransferase
LVIKGKENIEKGRNYIVMSNHQSLVDPWVLIGKLPLQLRWTIKPGVKKMPVFGYALERMGHIYVGRRKGGHAVPTLEAAIRRIKQGASAVFFPEGSRSKDGHLSKFHTGGAVVAIRSGVPILPITVNGSRFVLPKGTLALMPGKIRVLVGKSIDPGDFDDHKIDELTSVVKLAIQKNLDLEYGSFT